MLQQNLQVSRHILNNVAKNLSPFGQRFSKEVPKNDKFVRQSEVKIRNITPEEYKKNREQHPRPLSFRQLCKKLFFFSEKQSNPSSKVVHHVCLIYLGFTFFLNIIERIER